MKQLIIAFLLFICLQSFSQQPVFVIDDNLLYSVDLMNCTSNLVGKTNFGFNDIAFTPDGKLWGINDELYQIDTSNASIRLVGESIGTEGVSLVALNDSTLLDEVNDTLWSINVRNAQSYKIGNIGYAASGDLSWYDGNLYMTTYNQLIKIVLNSSNTEIVSAVPVNDTSKPIPEFLGLVTVSLEGSDSLIGFSDSGAYSAYRISPLDGTYQLICSSITPHAAYGAASLPLGIFPVHLLNFSFNLLNKAVQLQWHTTSEVNSDYFLVEKSTDGIYFEMIDKQQAATNSTTLKQYSYIDNNPFNTNYYRLKEVDLTGNYVYSNILLAKMPQLQSLLIIQNPVQNNLQLQINGIQSQLNYFTIFDFTGRRLKTFKEGSGLQSINVSVLRSGTYILQMITEDGQIDYRPFIKIN